MLNVTLDEYTAYADDLGRHSLSEIRGGKITVLDAEKLSYEEIEPLIGHNDLALQSAASPYFDVDQFKTPGFQPRYNINFVKSPKGTGKTTWLESLVDQLKIAGVSVLLIGHRRALISSTADKLGLECYLANTTSGDTPVVYRPATPYFAICADSLFKLDTKNTKYDVVIIDEVEQVFAHLLSSTLRENRRVVLHTLRHYLNSAKSLYLLDADLGKPTIDILDEMLDDEPRNFQAIVNTFRPYSRAIHLYGGRSGDHLIGDLLQSIERGEKCYVCSNSKAFITGLEKEIKNRISRQLKTIAVTSDNSNTPNIQKFVRNIREAALEYDVIFTSPALGTGIDITFENDDQLIDTVYGFFQPRINTHFDIDQQLARVRNPKAVKVWISSEEFTFETDSEAIKAELRLSEFQHNVLLGIEQDGTRRYHVDELYDSVFSSIVAYQRASKNQLRKHFIDLKRSNGWDVMEIRPDSLLASDGKRIRNDAKKTQQLAQTCRLLSAEQLTSEAYDNLRQKSRDSTLSEMEEAALRRYEIEAFYRQDLTEELLQMDAAGAYREQLRTFELLMSSDEELATLEKFDQSAFGPDQKRPLQKKKLLAKLFEAAGIIQNGIFQKNCPVDVSGLSGFIKVCTAHRLQLERIFDMSLRADLNKKPIHQLQTILRLVGLKLEKAGRDQSAGLSKVKYQLSVGKLESLQQWIAWRADASVKTAWQNGRESASDSEIDEKLPVTYRPYFDPLEAALRTQT